MKRKMIVITGADGSGKSTLVDALMASGLEAEVVSIWDAMDKNLFKSKEDIDNYLCELAPNARLLFLTHALVQSMESALKASDKTLIFNGYCYKYFGSEMALGASTDLVDQLQLLFQNPDLVIKLDIEDDLAFSRKQKLSRYECGVQLPSEVNFKSFQKLAVQKWAYFDQSDWETIDGALTKEEVLIKSLELIKSLTA